MRCHDGIILPFFILLIAVVWIAAFIIKPWLASRLKNTPPNDYPNWFIVNDAGKPLKVNKELSRFVREKYRQRKDDSACRCQRYLHVFSHTTEGKPLALLFDADDKVVNSRYLDEAINPANGGMRPVSMIVVLTILIAGVIILSTFISRRAQKKIA